MTLKNLVLDTPSVANEAGVAAVLQSIPGLCDVDPAAEGVAARSPPHNSRHLLLKNHGHIMMLAHRNNVP